MGGGWAQWAVWCTCKGDDGAAASGEEATFGHVAGALSDLSAELSAPSPGDDLRLESAICFRSQTLRSHCFLEVGAAIFLGKSLLGCSLFVVTYPCGCDACDTKWTNVVIAAETPSGFACDSKSYWRPQLRCRGALRC